MDVETIIDALIWMHIDDQIAYLQMLDHDYQEWTNEVLQQILESLDQIQTLGQADQLADLFGGRIDIAFGKKITIELA